MNKRNLVFFVREDLNKGRERKARQGKASQGKARQGEDLLQDFSERDSSQFSSGISTHLLKLCPPHREQRHYLSSKLFIFLAWLMGELHKLSEG